MATTNLTIKIDIDLKEKAEILFHDLGLDMTSAINLFVRKTLEEKKVPFDIDNSENPDYIAELHECLQQIQDGDVVIKTIDELKAMEK